MRRENTFKIDYSHFAVKPSVEKLYGFCRSILGLKREEIKRLQCHRGGGCAFIKVSNLTIAQKIVDEHDGKHEVDCEGKKHKLRITLEDGSVEVRVYDLPEGVSKAKIVNFLSAFGEVIAIHELSWDESNECEGIPLGIWSARMLVQRNIDSWVTIDGEQALVVYKGQLQSCRHCKEQAHTGISCVQNKKLLFQRSYANVTKQYGQVNRATTGHQPKKSAGVKPASTKSAGQKSAGTPTISADVFPELPKITSQVERPGPITQTSTQPTEVAVPSCAQTQRTQTSSVPAPPQALAKGVDIFKKPDYTLRSQTKSGNGEETDESSTSTNSKRNRGRPAGKKPRRDDGDVEQEEDLP